MLLILVWTFGWWRPSKPSAGSPPDPAPSGEELHPFTTALNADIVEVTLRSGVACRDAAPNADAGDRIESIEARLDAIDTWLDEFEAATKKKAVGG